MTAAFRYLDHAATTPVRREVLEAMWPFLAGGLDGGFANPSSRHEPGEYASRALADARSRIAAHLGCRSAEVILTSGGTEAANLAVKGIALAAPRGRRIVTTAIEHESVLRSADYLRRLHGFEVRLVALTDTGLVTPEALRAALRADGADDGATLVSIHLANNEIGAVQPIPALAAVAREAGVPFHTDAVQAAPWSDVGLSALGVDAVSIAGHKLGAPRGTGALALRAATPIEPLVHGGGQERGRRSGTEDVAGAVALARALEIAASERSSAGRAVAARDVLVERVTARLPAALLTGPRDARLPGHASFCFPGTSGEAVLLELERRGVVCSSGSACAAGRDEPSHVLVALGFPPEIAQTAVRFTFGAELDEAAAEEVADEVVAAVSAVGGLARR